MTQIPRDDRAWIAMADEMQRAMHLAPLTPEESVRAYENAKPVPMSDQDIDECVSVARSGRRKTNIPAEPIVPSADYAEIDEEVGEVVGMCRNEGEEDPEVQEMMRRERERALSENKTDEDADGKSKQKN